MKFTLTWLKDYLDTTATAEEVSTTLTNIGLEVESMMDMGGQLGEFVVARVEEAEKHPDADKLKVCKVFDGETTRQIVCGAPNARAGIYVVLAREGVCIPSGNFKIKKAKIRGVESNGMLCSADELGIGADAAGIIELAGEPAPGSPAAPALGMDDVVFDIAITPNRGDCFSVYGIARDLAAAGLGTLKEATIPQIGAHALGSSPSKVGVASDTAHCSEFTGITITNVKNGPSPDWLAQRLEMVGQKPISALVDITNYILLTFGRPLHAYDTRFLDGNLVAREAAGGEKVTLLNGEEYALDAGMVVIADDKKVLGLAGVMGGEHSGCQDDTTEVFIESALFAPVNIAQTGQKLNLTSDSRMRFERGVDTDFVTQGAKLATQMILDICGGEASELVTVQNQEPSEVLVAFDYKLVRQLTSLDINEDRSKEILNALGFSVEVQGDAWQVTPPSWRHDVSVAEDLVEEVARIHGYEHITPVSLPQSQDGAHATTNVAEQRLSIARDMLAHQGMVELHNWSFVSEAQARQVGSLNPALALANPISSELSVMRSSLVPHLLGSAERNLNNGVKQIAIFETGQIFEGVTYDEQHRVIAGLLTGQKKAYTHSKEQFAANDAHYSLYDAKTAAFSVLAAFGVNTEQLSLTREAPETYHPGRSMRISLGGKVTLGYVGELHPALTAEYDVDSPAACFEILVENVPVPKQKTTTKKPLTISPYPSVDRDFAFTVAEDVEVEQIRRAAMGADKKLITSAEVFDVYQGKHMEPGQKSVALRVTLQPTEKTLTDEEIQKVADAVIEKVGSATGAQLRQ